jgi:hypothetical protein
MSEEFKTVDPKLNGKEISLKWGTTMYHTPQDDMNRPLNFDAAVKFTRVNLAVGYEIAQENARRGGMRTIFSWKSSARNSSSGALSIMCPRNAAYRIFGRPAVACI